MSRSNISLLARSASVLAIGIAAPTVVQAQDAPGVYQSDTDGDGTNLYVVPAGTTVFGQEDIVVAGSATATAQVFCAASAGGDAEPGDGGDDGPTCSDFGAITQTNAATVTATNSILVVGDQVVRADATATGTFTVANADATIDTGIQQNLVVVDNAVNNITLTGPGSLTVRADAFANGNGSASSAFAEAHITEAAIEQVIFAPDVGQNIIDMEGDINVVVNADAIATVWGGNTVTASAELDGAAVGQVIFFATTALNDFTVDNGGIVNIDVNANAHAAGGPATAFATAEIGVGQYADADLLADNDMTVGVGGTIDIDIAATAIGSVADASANLGVEAGFFNNEGIGQHAEADSASGSANNSFINSGVVDMDVVAIADASQGDASADAQIDTGIYQFASATATNGEAHNSLTNALGATIGINANASAEATNVGGTGGVANANATVGHGIFQSATADSSATVGLVNDGTITISATALADGDLGASANASIGTGISQNASGTFNAFIDLTNDGTVNIVADAHAIAGAPGATAGIGGSADATASIDTGIYQDVHATGVLGWAIVDLDNTGTINILADAEADAGGIANGSADASASIETGIYQSATASGSFGLADASIANTGGTINIVAMADANGSEASASASITNYGIYQSAVANGSGGTADVDLVNSGTINIVADANAVAVGTTLHTGSEDADASATISSAGIYQSADANGISGNASVNLANSGTINIVADADAVAASDDADADATIDTGIYQSADANGTNGVANVDLTNGLGNSINIVADANALGTSADASASISTGIFQSADANGISGIASIDLTNSGTINIVANAEANAVAGLALAANAASASADASVSVGISQSASANGTSGSANVSLNNSGTINIIANAIANGGTSADASASVTPAISQGAYANGSGGVATIDLTNTGTINILGNAHAVATSGSAEADVSVSGITQSASANGTSGVASIGISNGAGNILNIIGNATATGTSDASASADIEGISQSASANGSQGMATVDLTNSGTINIIGNAKAKATAATSLQTVSASVTHTGITQSANANGVSGVATVNLANNLGGSIVLAGHGTAIATGSGNADADVTVEGISQSADANGTNGEALITLTNDGTLTILADASAVAVATSLAVTNGSASASASVSSGISQFADANGTSGHASVGLINTGTLTLEADAKAVADGFASASASVDTAIFQSANANGSQGVAEVALTNSGTINLLANATASGDTSASATANVTNGISQSADANGSSGLAEVDLTNSGTINIIANAKGVATSGSANASAEVSGISQSADANGFNGTADVSLVNDAAGVVNIIANGTATAGGSSASASASVFGISQNADADGSSGLATVNLNNAGTINIEGNANASATGLSFFQSAQATVSITGISQFAEADGFNGTANVDLVNSGAINIVGNANATTAENTAGTGSGSANAEVTLEGISQSAHANGSFGLATVNLTNTATILLDANAVAVADSSASASAWGQSGISQFASANGFSGTALIALNNTGPGTITINANARATADNVTANAYANGIDQDADANGSFGTAGVDLVNSGVISISATALGNGTSFANVSATASGITQEADASGFGGSAIVELVNSGTITVKADADANATSGSASAYASVEGIDQSANANGSFGLASVDLVNSGTINLDADANALASSSATATARVSSGISQSANANGTSGVATVDLINTGTINITADARAVSTSTNSAFASAFINGINQTANANDSFGSASASLINNGGINIIGNAAAVAEQNSATAWVSISGITQNVNATGIDGVANAFLSNTGDTSIHITGNATATGFDGDASASVSISGLNQDVNGNSFAQAEIINSGTINIEGNAKALADDDVFAFVFITDGIDQFASASAPDGDANALLANSGTLNMLASAHAQGDDTATASAWITDPVDQTAIGGGTSGEALASFENSGTFLMNATATALGGDDVRAIANIGNFGGAIHQFASGGSGASAIFTNGGTPLDNGSVTINASAKAMSDGGPFSIDDDATASAHAFGVNQTAIARTADFTAVATVLGGTSFSFTAGGAEALASVVNNGAFSLTADAEAFAQESANAHAHISSVIDQFVNGSSAQALIDNNELISVEVEANATGHTQAGASATIDGINQTANASRIDVNVVVSPLVPTDIDFVFTNAPAGPALASLDNDGGIVMSAFASALGGPVDTLVGGTAASAFASVDGVDQDVRGLTATAEVINDAAMSFNATANAGGIDSDPGTAVVTNATSAFAFATASGIQQSVTAVETEITANVPLPITPPPIATGDVATTPVGSALASVVNNAAFDVGAVANATATSFASAGAFAFGVFQDVQGLTATAEVTNGDLATFSVDAEAAASGSAASAQAVAQGITQLVRAVGTNTDFAVSTTPTTGGTTITVATTVSVTPVGEANASVTNTGTMRVEADATALGSTFASAVASAGGVFQSVAGLDWNATFINGPGADFDVGASASATADTSAFAFASATGYQLIASGGSLLFDNNSTFNVSAAATAVGTTGTAFAHAIGLDASAVGTGTPVVFGGDLNGTIDNDAAFTVLAKANGGTGAIASTADAHGIILDSGANTLVITNTSLFDVRSITSANTGTSTATGILARDNGAGAGPGVGDQLTINNVGGTIFVGESVNGGTLFRHGMAIDVSTAPNPTTINLQGAGAVNGSIYGDIDLAATDIVNVSNGRTSFDGKINPEFHPQPGVPTAVLPAQGLDPSPAFDGTLNILSGGSLFLRDNDSAANTTGGTLVAPATYDGAAKVYIGTLNANAGGNLAYELQTAGTQAQATAHYPQIFANTANLGGALEVVVNNSSLAGPLLYDTVLYDNIIEADVRNGTFSNLIFTPPGALINGSIVYDTTSNVDIRQTRTPFGQLGNETPNQRAVGGGIEAVYATVLANPAGSLPFANLLAEIFTLNAADYYDALDQLSGVQYPLYTHALRNNTFTNNMFVADQTDCAIDIRGVDACRNAEKGARFWILGTYNWQELDSTNNFIGYDGKNWAALLGVDYRFGNGLQLGIFGGYRNVDVDFDDAPGSQVDSDGFQLGLTAAYDVGDFYIRGVGSYSSLNGDSERQILIGSGPGLVSGTAIGEPDTRVWSFYGEAGARFDMGGSWLTPFVAVDHTAIKLRSFTESGVPGANLAADSQTNSQTSGLVGLKWAGNFGGIVPEAKIAYRHDFGSRFYGVDLRFADAPAGSNFSKTEPYDRNSIVAGLSLAGVISDRVTGRIGWQGRFNDEVQDHAVYGSLTFKFGGAKPAPEPAPAPEPVPPPPPEPVPPPPVEAVGPYIVFFDWDKDEITPQAAAILDNAAASYQQTGSANVVIAGHADRSGSDQYNVGLSQRRATNVRTYLAGRGVPDGAMSTEAFGESRPLVETADGVREPQNRRVEITYGPGSGQ